MADNNLTYQPIRAGFEVQSGPRGATGVFTLLDNFEGLGLPELVKMTQDAAVNKIKVQIHSGGGDALEGIAIYALLKQMNKPIRVEILGLAGSIASVVAMAATENQIFIAPEAFMFVHRPWTVTVGNSAQMRDTANLLDKVEGSIVMAYKRHLKMPDDAIKGLMVGANGEGTWYNAQEAMAVGLAHHLLEDAVRPHNCINASLLKGAPDAAMRFAADAKERPKPAAGADYDATTSLLAELLDVINGHPGTSLKGPDDHLLNQVAAFIATAA